MDIRLSFCVSFGSMSTITLLASRAKSFALYPVTINGSRVPISVQICILHDELALFQKNTWASHKTRMGGINYVSRIPCWPLVWEVDPILLKEDHLLLICYPLPNMQHRPGHFSHSTTCLTSCSMDSLQPQ